MVGLLVENLAGLKVVLKVYLTVDLKVHCLVGRMVVWWEKSMAEW